MTVSTTESREPMPFHYRVTNRGGGDVGVDIGDEFAKSDSWPNTMDGYLAQVGLDMVRKGLQFMGLSNQDAEMLCLLAIKESER